MPSLGSSPSGTTNFARIDQRKESPHLKRGQGGFESLCGHQFMKISQLILALNKFRKEHGDLDVLGSAPEYEPLYDIEAENISYLEPSEYIRVESPIILIGPK